MGNPDGVTFTCPECHMVSHNPNDVHYGYCGNCHEYTRLTGEMVEVRPGLAMPDWLHWILKESAARGAADLTRAGSFTAAEAAEWLREIGFEFDPEKHVLGGRPLMTLHPVDETEFRPGIRGSVAHPPKDDR